MEILNARPDVLTFEQGTRRDLNTECQLFNMHFYMDAGKTCRVFFLQFVNGCSPSGTRKGNLGRMETGLCMFPRQPGFDNSLVFLVDLLK